MIVDGQTEARAQLSSTIIDYHEPFDQGLRDFPQTKIDNGINSPFLLNEHGDPRFFLQVFAKNSVMKNIFEAEKSLIVEHDFFWKIVPNWVYFGQREDFKLTTELSEKEK